jgi:DNA repair protein RecN (Recombination protein N)
MLNYIHIRNFAVIDELELELGTGMCVLTGETGAGKSILVDALGLVLGDRADSSVVRHGTKRAEITIAVEISKLDEVKSRLAEYDLASNDECILRRIIARDGRSKAYINGTLVPLSILKPLGEMLVDIHGQHEHQSLLRIEMQRRLLDAHAGNEQKLQKLDSYYHQWRALKSKLETLIGETQEREARIDLLSYQIQELSDASLEEDPIETLEEEQQRLTNTDKLRQVCESAYFNLYERDDLALYSQLGRIIHNLDETSDLDSEIAQWRELLAAAQVQLAEAAKGLHRYSSELEEDPQRLEWVESRMGLIHDLARKHRISPQHLPLRLNELQLELASLQAPESNPTQLGKQLKELADEYRRLATDIRRSREVTARALSRETTSAMQELGMNGGQFQIEVMAMDDSRPSPSGLDKVEFLVSANPGQPLQALSKVASGGELSRISLAIQMVAAQSLSIPTLIFDEVDAGIGGAIAEAVGQQLQNLGGSRQVLCVTHLPQVAAQAHDHFKVSKLKRDNQTSAHIRLLKSEDRVKEIARMLGGRVMTDQTIAHAKEMITQTQNQ